MTETLKKNTTENKVSPLLERAIPDHLFDENPMFQEFMEAYFEFLEQEKEPVDIIRNLRDYRDIDETTDEFFDYIRKELMPSIPKDIDADPRKLIKIIRDFYKTKGTEKAYRFLFRVLFDEHLNFFYPKTNILKTDDGKWEEPRSIKVTVSDENVFLFEGTQITGQTNGTTAVVERLTREQTDSYAELFLSNIRGTYPYFDEGEVIEAIVEVQEDVCFEDEELIDQYARTEEINLQETIQEVYHDLEITVPGSGYSVNDYFLIRSEDDNIIGSGVVLKNNPGPIISVDINNGGEGYNGDIISASFFTTLPLDYEYENQLILDTQIQSFIDSVVADTNTNENDIIEPDSNNSEYDLITNYQLSNESFAGNGDPVVFSDIFTSNGSGATGKVLVVDDFGSIEAIEIISMGDNYEQPTAEVISDTGEGAQLSVRGGAGIEEARLKSFPLVSRYPNSTLDFTVSGDGNAQGTLTNTRGFAEYPGYYINEDGHIDSFAMRLQDDYYYQDFSYVLKSKVPLDKYKELLYRIIHPLGFKMFGELEELEQINLNSQVQDSIVTIQ